MSSIEKLFHKIAKRCVKNALQERQGLLDEGYHSQYGQDKFAAEYFKHKKGGVFVDIGANDGITLSNSYYLEKELDWTGVAIEPIPEIFAKCQSVRDCHCENICISHYCGTTKFISVQGESNMLSGIADKYSDKHYDRLQREVESYGGTTEELEVEVQTLEAVLNKHGIGKVDFLSIDTEGGELDILKSIDFDKIQIELISVENNGKGPEFRNFLKQKGYKFIATAKCDEIYFKAE